MAQVAILRILASLLLLQGSRSGFAEPAVEVRKPRAQTHSFAASGAGASPAHLASFHRSAAAPSNSSRAQRRAPFACVHDHIARLRRAAGVEHVAGAQRYARPAPGRRAQAQAQAHAPPASALDGALPLRIVPIFVGLSSLPAAQQAFLAQKLVPAAVARWAGLLATPRVRGGLFAHRECAYIWKRASGPWPCSQLASAPAACASGVADDVPLPFDAALLGADTVYAADGTPTVVPAGGPGLADADFGLFVTAKQTVGGCGGSSSSSVLAYAQTCQRDQFDRPTWGRVNFCPAALSAAPADFAAQLSTAVHELSHALGFSAESWPLWRGVDAARTPLTPRDEAFPEQPRADFLAQYSCAASPALAAAGSGAAFVAADSSLAYSSARGMTADGCGSGAKLASSCVLNVVAPRSALAARAHFACATLPGAELENQLTSCDVAGSHWEQRVLNGELMASARDPRPPPPPPPPPPTPL